MHSPLRDPRTRFAGQSLAEMITVVQDDISTELVSPFLLWGIAIFTLVYAFVPGKPNPWIFVVIALGATLVAIRRIRALLKKKKLLRKGMVGEQILGKFLEEQLMPEKYHIIHDLVAKVGERKFNVDHVIVGPTGIFSVETKNWTNPDGSYHQIFYDGKKILVDGKAPVRDPLVQGIAGAKWLKDLVETLTGRSFFVQPIVVFLGSYTTKNPGYTPAWVLNEQAVPGFVRHNFNELDERDVLLITAQLKKYSEECGKN